MTGDIIINGEAAIIGPGDRLIVAISDEHFSDTEAARLSSILTERLGDRFVVIVNPNGVTVSVLRSEA